MRFAQEYAGQKLHLVRQLDTQGYIVEDTALYGRNCHKRGAWRLTINLPMGMACLRCWRIWQRMRARKEVA